MSRFFTIWNCNLRVERFLQIVIHKMTKSSQKVYWRLLHDMVEDNLNEAFLSHIHCDFRQHTMIVRGAAYIMVPKVPPKTPRMVLRVLRFLTRPTTNPAIRMKPVAIAMNNFTTCTYQHSITKLTAIRMKPVAITINNFTTFTYQHNITKLTMFLSKVCIEF